MPTKVGIRGVSKGDTTIVLKGDNMSNPDPLQCYRDTNCKDNTCGECDNCNFEEWYEANISEDEYLTLSTFATKDTIREFARGIYNGLYGAD
tara:strand:+ start:338 stop:613 length:276 start_codon:yes stop_codon:yes gene_type:complete